MLKILAPAIALLLSSLAHAQALIQGRVVSSGAERIPMSTILAIGNSDDPAAEAISFRTWETHPAGWFRLSGAAGRYTLAFTNPAHFMRPRVLTNQFLTDGDSLELRVHADFDFACFHDKAWDTKPARRYWQPFVARGTGVTAVGFKLATDGVDGPGPGKQDVILSIHAPTEGSPETWPRIGPEAYVRNVDCGGAKGYWYSAGWNSGEVPTTPGEPYAVSIRPAKADGVFQAFWRPRADGTPGVYRLGSASESGDSARRERDIWLAVSTDGDGLVIPYNKRVHSRFHALTHLERKWSQTYVAKGRGLSSVVLYAAVSGKQPPLSRQRVAVRVRAGGPQGPIVGAEKIAVGNGDYTGDASWGHFVAAFAPGDVPLEPGRPYAIEFETIESTHTIGGFVNIKGQMSDGRAGFNPYRKCPRDDHPGGAAYRHGTEKQDFDLDMQIVEYEHAPESWEHALASEELLRDAWKPMRVGPRTRIDTESLRVDAGSDSNGAIDGGWSQRVESLDHTETYRLSGRVRCTWPAEVDRACLVGVDPTGQIEDPDAPTIQWTILPRRHGEFVTHSGPPIRPRDDAMSIWLRARCKSEDSRFPFRAEFADFSLRRVRSGVPARD